MAHCTCFFSLDQTEEDKEKGVIKVSLLVNRFGQSHSKSVKVLHQFSLGRFYIDSKWEIKKTAIKGEE